MKKRTVFRLSLALAALVLAAGLLFVLLTRPARSDPAPAALTLDESWAAGLLACASKGERTAYLTATAQRAADWGCDALLFTGRSKSGALFPDSTGSLTQASALDGFDTLRALKSSCRKAGLTLYLLVSDEDGTVLPAAAAPDWAKALAQKKKANLLYAGSAEGFSTALQGADTYTDGQTFTLLGPVSPAALASLRSGGVGAVLGSWSELSTDETPARLLAAFEAPADALPDTSIPRTAAICYPADGATLYSDTLCLTGTSDPSAPLTLNGEAVERPGSAGVWTHVLSLTDGDNTFTLTQGNTTQTINVQYVSDAGWTPTAPVSDGSAEAEAGQWLQVSADGIASLLSDYTDASTILATLPQGTIARVEKSEEYTTSGNKLSWAYQVDGGGWLRASDVTLLDENDAAAAPAAFTALAGSPNTSGEDWILTGSGSPLWRAAQDEDGSLTFTFHNASFTGAQPAAADFAASVNLDALDADELAEGETAAFRLRFTFAKDAPLWGYTVHYTAQGLTVSLRRAPVLSSDASAPLTGVRVLLDAGHGGQDNGASGCAGSSGPLEKDLNLALALAAKTRLEQLGATATLTRSDDSYLTLAQRLAQTNDQMPDLFLSLHHNSIPLTRDTSGVNGAECYYFTSGSKPLAAALTANFAADFGCSDRGAREDYYFVTRTTACPAVLLESGFVTTALEYERCADSTALWAEGGAVAEAVLSVLSAG